ncbi:MAG: cytosine permease [Mycobacterium sp.]
MSTSPLDTRPDDDAAVPFDANGIEPIPDDSRNCSPWELFWIWSGANIAPINWVLGALGITLGLSLVETLVVVAAGNILGCSIFGVFNVIGHRTAVNQMVLGRAPFGRWGSIVPGVVQFLLTMGWVGVNTWVVLDLVLAILAEVGVTGGAWLEVAVAASIMAIQLGLALYGFYAIRSFEKYTVPATVVVMAVMTVVAIATTDVNWSLAGAELTPGEKLTVWLAALGACLASAGSGSDPSTLVVGTFGVMAIPVLTLLIHGPIATNILNLYSCSLAALSIGVRSARWKVTLVDYFAVRRGRLDAASLYLSAETSAYGKVNSAGLLSLAPASRRAGSGSSAWCPPCRVRWPSPGATPTSPGSQAVSSPASCTSSWLVRCGHD